MKNINLCKRKIIFFLFLLPSCIYSQNLDEWYIGKKIINITYEGITYLDEQKINTIFSNFIGEIFTYELFFDLQNSLNNTGYFENIQVKAIPVDAIGSALIIHYNFIEISESEYKNMRIFEEIFNINSNYWIIITESKNYHLNDEIKELISDNKSNNPIVYKFEEDNIILYFFSGYYINAYGNCCYIKFTLKLLDKYMYFNMELEDSVFNGLEMTLNEIDYFKANNNFKNQYDGTGIDMFGEYTIMKQIQFGDNVYSRFRNYYTQLLMHIKYSYSEENN